MLGQIRIDGGRDLDLSAFSWMRDGDHLLTTKIWHRHPSAAAATVAS